MTIRSEKEENLFLYLVQHVARAAQEGDIIAGDGDHFLIIYLSVYIYLCTYTSTLRLRLCTVVYHVYCVYSFNANGSMGTNYDCRSSAANDSPL